MAGERSSSLRNSLRKLRPFTDSVMTGPAVNNNNDEVAAIYLQTFAHHWAACQDRLHAYEPLRDPLISSLLFIRPVVAIFFLGKQKYR
jgi:hypothetical protein